LPTVLWSDMKARASTLFLKMWFSGFFVFFVVTRKAPWLAVHWYQINFTVYLGVLHVLVIVLAKIQGVTSCRVAGRRCGNM
jgi:hypothetical protein